MHQSEGAAPKRLSDARIASGRIARGIAARRARVASAARPVARLAAGTE